MKLNKASIILLDICWAAGQTVTLKTNMLTRFLGKSSLRYTKTCYLVLTIISA
jgi:hypothetical protein